MNAIIDSITAFLLSVFGGNKYLTVLAVSLLPTVEARGAIPIAFELGISPGIAYIYAAVTSFLVSPFLLLLLRPILNKMKKTKTFKKIALFFESNFKVKADKIKDDAIADGNRGTLFKKLLGIYAFVALPLPLTGVWTGSAIAAFTDVNPVYSLPAILLGNLTASGIVALLAFLLGDYSYIIILVLAAFILISAAILVARALFLHKKNSGKE